ncbi:Transcriptional regulator, AraC family [Leucobacter sp. 7(1)]|uniref:helix-turn-helix domain-containing protein n=1 Tax=Leucobacter sp. 7(1) TaxID=1255613 RepID=UPI00097EEEF4|nr:AraC family transcriptional regulator [Leucobacter sp. 7(1)]SJN10827.1 Transcriptional regulator, AraC family [Leucobacter sp. 7(1)]
MDTDDSRVSVTYAQVRRTSLHTHSGVLEIVLVLRGELEVTVSCERFVLGQGDYAVLNEGDPHVFVGSEENVTAILQIKLDAFSDAVPGLSGVIYACESFDLPRFRRAEGSLRALILRAILADSTSRNDAAASLLTELAAGYAFEDYYERQRELTPARRHQFRSIVSAMQDRLASRDVLGQIAQDQHYRKDSLSRIVREATAVSFSDLLTYLRVSSAERRLVSTDLTVAEIAAECGFSDVKYLTRAFRSWFGESPADYRRRVRAQYPADDQIITSPELGAVLAEQLTLLESGEPGPPRLSVTPLLLKNLGGRSDLFRSIAELARTLPPPPRGLVPATPHLLPIQVTPRTPAPLDLIAGLDREQFQPALLVASSDPDLVRSTVQELVGAGERNVLVWLTYDSGQGVAEERRAAELRSEYGVSVVPMRLG